MSTYLDPETIENILSHRPVYLAIHEDFDYEHTTHDTLAVEFTFEKAAFYAVQAALKDVLKHGAYMPKKRWYLEEFKGISSNVIYWTDSWLGTKIDICKVEQWLPGRGRVDTQYFDFDSWFKNHILEDQLTCNQVKTQLKTWSDTLSQGTLPPELLQQMHTSLGRFKEVDDMQKWVGCYGSEAPGWKRQLIPA